MFLSLDDALLILEHYKYLVIFPIAVLEGPIIIIISGFLVYLGVLNGIVAFFLLVIADVIGDVMYYSIGRFWRNSIWVKRSISVLGYSDKSEAFLEAHFREHKGKTFLLGKISHGIGGAIQVASGIARVKFPEFLMYSFIGTIPKVAFLLYIGFFLGSSYVRIDGYLDYVAWVTIGVLVVAILFYFLLRKYTKRIFMKDDQSLSVDKE